jgi:MoaA/NifB/PqqE/SkfB family radical SAM enzyme
MNLAAMTRGLQVSKDLLPKLPLIFGAPGTTFALSIDITNACNLDCVGCYWRQHYDRLTELSDDEWLSRIHDIKAHHPHIVHATWVGGEPTLRQSLLRRALALFPLNWIVTNGTRPLPDWGDVTFWVSLDGTAEHHDQIRVPYDPHNKLPTTNRPSMYARTKGNILSAVSRGLRVYIHTVLNSENAGCVHELVAEWARSGVRGIAFSFYTPMPGVADPLWIPPDARDRVVDQLLALKRSYGSFIEQTRSELALFRSDQAPSVVGANCLLLQGASVSFDSTGSRKSPCVMGAVDCERCGCAVPYRMNAMVRARRVSSVVKLARTFV